MKKIYVPIMITTLIYFSSCNNSSTPSSTGDSTATKSNNDTTSMLHDSAANATTDQASIDFATTAAKGGMAEVAIGKIAEKKATTQRIKDFAMMMVNDHTKANDELKQKATSLNITLPSSVADADQKMIDSVSMKTGKDFDKAYMNMMLADHKKTIDLFAKESSNGTNSTLKDFASSTLPTLQKHLTAVESITGIK